MRLFVILALVLIVLAAGAVFVGPQLIPAEVYRSEIEKAVEGATGRTLIIGGEVNVTVFPSLKARVADAKLANVPGGKADYMAEIGEMQVGIALWPLLQRKVDIKSFVLSDAVIHLEVDKTGRQNWVFETAPAPEGETGEEAQGATDGLGDLTLGDVRLVNGLVTYSDAQSGARYEVSQINSVLSLPGLDKPFEVKGSAAYNGEPLDITARLEKTRAAIEGGDSALSLDISGKPFRLAFAGTGTFGEAFALAGDLSFESASVRRLAAWAGSPIEGKSGFGPMNISGKVAATGTTYKFENASLRFDDIKATGALEAKLGGAVPTLNGRLKTDLLDLRPYIAQSTGAGGGAQEGAPASWSEDPIDASALKAFNGDLAFEAGGILLGDLKIGTSDLTVTVRNGVLTANIPKLALYKGLAQGLLVLDARQPRTAMQAKLSLVGLDLEGFLKDAVKSERFIGTGLFEINLSGQGRSQKDIISSLSGNAAIKFTNGAIKGVDLVKIASLVNKLSGKETPSESSEATAAGQSSDAQTRFVEFGGTFAVASGIMKNSDFKMLNELISLTGRGNIDLPRQTIDFRLDPGKSQEDGGLKVALLVKGPLGSPKITPDASELIRNEVREQLGDSPAGQILDSLLGGRKDGGDQKSPDKDGTESRPEPAKQLIKDLFGR